MSPAKILVREVRVGPFGRCSSLPTLPLAAGLLVISVCFASHGYASSPMPSVEAPVEAQLSSDEAPPGGWPRPPTTPQTYEEFVEWRAEQERMGKATRWRVGNEPIELAPCGVRAHCEVSAWCRHPEASCQALEAAKTPAKGDGGPGGTNPGHAVCERHFGGQTVVATHLDTKDEQSFCTFPDRSAVSSNAIWIW
jgi:hypothetical protein